ncbi:MAG: ADP-glyceromanno-heptose 6-epimerase [Microscillaceae bacterium]|nr:ADP-glyceromanno-heptose 6-epimerase [Microscillaceae bacterium]MDW8461357.1 ADP-glyceromanno-heptose 6-epimerase [Cytophagales bacterium]
MIVVTGALGFIGSCLITRLNQENFNYIIAVDDFSKSYKHINLEGKKILHKIDRKAFFEWLDRHHPEVEFVFHFGARTDTTEFNTAIFDELNVGYSQTIWKKCAQYQLPLVYASSAATYGAGELGYDDNEALIPQLKPLNPYGESKNNFDIWALQQIEKPFFWVGLKFFNVYGPNEYHKGRMASVIFHAFHQIKASGQVKLFKSHRPDYRDGEQRRDFVYVKDVVNVCMFWLYHRKNSGIYNLGSGKARTFLDLARNTFAAMQVPENIVFIDTPEDIRDKYQYFTQANMQKLWNVGYNQPFHSLEEGIKDYVQNYLLPNRYF